MPNWSPLLKVSSVFCLILLALAVLLSFGSRHRKDASDLNINESISECFVNADLSLDQVKERCQWQKKQTTVFWSAKQAPFLWLRIKNLPKRLSSPYLSLVILSQLTVLNDKGHILYQSGQDQIVPKAHLVPLPSEELDTDLYLRITSRSNVNIGVQGSVHLGEVSNVLKQLVFENGLLLLAALFYLFAGCICILGFILSPFYRAHLSLVSAIFFLLMIESLTYADQGLLDFLTGWEGFSYFVFYPARYFLAAALFYYICLITPSTSNQLRNFLKTLSIMYVGFFGASTAAVSLHGFPPNDVYNYPFAMLNIFVCLLSFAFLLRNFTGFEDDFSKILSLSFFATTVVRAIHGLGLWMNLFIFSRSLVGIAFGALLIYLFLTKIKLDREKAKGYLELKKMLDLTQTMMQSIAHDLKQPFSKFSMMMDLLKNADSADEHKNLVTNLGPLVEKSNGYVQEVLDDILSLNDEHPLTFNGCSPFEIIRESIFFCIDFGVHKKLKFKYSVEHCQPIYGNKEKLIRVLVNLLKNAQDATPDNGVITLFSRDTTIGKTSFVEIGVHNTGSYVKPNRVSQIFQPFISFSQAGRSKTGTGLGLYISKNIMTSHNGSLTVQSCPKDGTTFSMVCPADRGDDLNLNKEIFWPKHNQYDLSELLHFKNNGGDRQQSILLANIKKSQSRANYYYEE